MRKLAVVLLLVTGCAAAPAEEAVEGPRIAPAQESASGDEVEPEGNGGGDTLGVATGPGGAASPDASGGLGGSDASGDDVASWGGEACRTACATVASVGCQSIVDVCIIGEVVTIGGVSIPCGLGIVAACVGGTACWFGCPS